MRPSSALYRGRVRHQRLAPFDHGFTYRVYYALFDIDRLDEIASRLRLFSVDRWNLFSVARSDHGPANGDPLRPWADRIFGGAGVDLDGGPIMLLTHPRVLGYVFNPISIWYGYDRAGTLRGVLYEVRNTFGDRHTYVVPVDATGLRHTTQKRLHVSPFNDMDDTYRFTVTEPGDHLALAIDEHNAEGRLFRAGLALSRIDLSDWNLARLFATHPLLTAKVISAIHWQALKLWLKGAKYQPVPEPPAHEFTIVSNEDIATESVTT